MGAGGELSRGGETAVGEVVAVALPGALWQPASAAKNDTTAMVSPVPMGAGYDPRCVRANRECGARGADDAGGESLAIWRAARAHVSTSPWVIQSFIAVHGLAPLGIHRITADVAIVAQPLGMRIAGPSEARMKINTQTQAAWIVVLVLGSGALWACGSDASDSEAAGGNSNVGQGGSGGGAGANAAGASGRAAGGTSGAAGGTGAGASDAGSGGNASACPEVAGTPVLVDSFESGDMSKTNADGFTWGSNNRTSVVTATHAVWHNGSINNPIGAGQNWEPFDGAHSLRFRYPALEAWSEQRFDLGGAYPEVWIRYWLRVPENFVHENVTGGAGNNKFFALWMDDYSQHGDGPTIVWNFWPQDDKSSYFTYSLSQETGGTDGHHGKYTDFIRSPHDQGRWMQVVLYAKMSTSSTANDGESRIWRRWQDECDFTLISETTGRGFVAPAAGPNGWAAGYIMGWANSGYAEDTEWLLDDFTVSTSSLLPD